MVKTTPDPPALAEGSVHPWVSKSGSRPPDEAGAEAWGLDTPPRGGGVNLEGTHSSDSTAGSGPYTRVSGAYVQSCAQHDSH